MNHPAPLHTPWSTASFGNATDTTPMELSALGEHLDTCHGERGRLFGLRCKADVVRGFVATRFVTSLLAVALLIGLALLFA